MRIGITTLNFTYFKVIAGLFLILTFSGCHSYILDDAQFEIRDSFADGDYERSEKLLAQFGEKNIYKSKDAILWNLENGMVQHFIGNYDSSTAFFSAAELGIEDAYAKSISRGVLSFIGNDNKLVYNGEPYEDIYLNAFKALNFIHLKDWEGALVETRRMAFKMEQLDIKIKGLADAFAKSDTSGNVEWKSDNINIQNSALSHYLATILYAKSGKADDARIEFEKLGIAFKEQSTVWGVDTFDASNLESIKEPETYNVLLTSFTGQNPIKYQNDVRIFTDNGYLKFSFPELQILNSEVYNVQAVVNGKSVVGLDLIEEMDLVSAEVYKAKEPIIYGRALARALLKEGATKVITKAVKEENKTIGEALGLLSLFFKEATEKADLRGWQTLPGQAWMNVIKLPPGTHKIELEYLSENGIVLFYDEFEVDIQPDTKLELVESIYSY